MAGRRVSMSGTRRVNRRLDALSAWRWAAFSVYLMLHELIVAGLPTPRFPTSVDYLHLDFTGRAVRLWAVPLLYKVLPTDFLRIAGQAALAAISWWVLASVAASIVRDLRVRIALQATILAL